MKHIVNINNKLLIITIFFVLCLSNNTFSQNKFRLDSLVKKKHSPALASAMSAIVPGSGQIYNKKYWKFPVIYAGIGTLAYFTIDNNKEYQKFKTAFRYNTDNDPSTTTEYDDILSSSEIEQEMNRWRKFRDLNVIMLFGVYILNVIDASVDAHLFDYDVSDDLSLNLNPALFQYNNNPSVGLKLCINIK